jgi:hypothetical protein
MSGIKNILIASMIIFCNRVGAQNNDSKFQRDFLKKFHYPEILKNSCTATFANLLIDISDDGTIDSFIVSDSAPQVFKDEFNRIKGALNIDFIKSLIIEKNLKSSAIIIPLFYVYSSEYCVNSFEQVGYLEKIIISLVGNLCKNRFII